jgi:hypothetical protein
MNLCRNTQLYKEMVYEFVSEAGRARMPTPQELDGVLVLITNLCVRKSESFLGGKQRR